jgi:hypothetical protein
MAGASISGGARPRPISEANAVLVEILVSHVSANNAERWGTLCLAGVRLSGRASRIMFRIPMGNAGGAGGRGVLRLRIPVRFANRNTALRMTT